MVTELFITVIAGLPKKVLQNMSKQHGPFRMALRAAAARTAQTSKIYSISALACRT